VNADQHFFSFSWKRLLNFVSLQSNCKQTKYEEVMESLKTNKRNPSRHRIEEHNQLNWLKASRKLINAGKMKPERVALFEELQALAEKYKHVNQYQLR